MYIDTHTHLFSAKFDEDRHEMVKRSIDAGIDQMYLPNIDANSIDAVFKLYKAFPENCIPMMGLHPCSVKGDFEEQLAKIKEALYTNDSNCAVGEAGLDYYWDLTYKEQQQQALRTQIEWAKDLKIPIVLHTRDSFEDSWNIINEMNDENLSGVFHCFSGTVAEAEKVMKLGNFVMGIGGVITFKKSTLGEVVKEIPMEYLVLETDSPYLAPTPFRGKRNESSYIPYIAGKIAEVKNMSIEDVAAATTENALRIFAKN